MVAPKTLFDTKFEEVRMKSTIDIGDKSLNGPVR